MRYATPYIVKEEIFSHKHVEDNGDIVEMRIFRIAKSEQNPEGIVYSCVYIRKGKRLVAYDNFEGHLGVLRHHRHVKDRIEPYLFVDEWKLIADFNDDIEKIKRGIIQ